MLRAALVCLSLLAPACGSAPSHPTGSKAKADANWSGLVARYGK